MIDPRRLRLYVVTSADRRRDHLDIARAAIAGGASAVQLRAPERSASERMELATAIATACREAGILFIVNDDVAAAIAAGADGVHVGQDTEVNLVRASIGPEMALGVSVGNASEAALAERAGADHLGVTVWATATKPEARPVGLDGIRSVAAATPLPIVGIGGIDAANAGDVIAAGAAGVAVISVVAGAAHPVEATRNLARSLGMEVATR